MTIIHNLGFPRIGAQRELKFGLEAFWRGEASAEQLNILSTWLREQHWQLQSTLDYVPVGDFSLYDQVLDMSFTLGHLPERVQGLPGSELDQYFRVARGRSAGDSTGVAAGEMTKWFDTNYHYIVPEFTAATQFKLNPQRLVQQLTQARAQVPARVSLWCCANPGCFWLWATRWWSGCQDDSLGSILTMAVYGGRPLSPVPVAPTTWSVWLNW